MSDSQKYRENYEKLRAIAERLAGDEAVDIDELVPLVDEASAAYKVCRARIEAVEKALAERLGTLDETDEGQQNGDDTLPF